MSWLHFDIDKKKFDGAVTDDDGEEVAVVTSLEINADTISYNAGGQIITKATGSGRATIELAIADLAAFQKAIRSA